MNLTVIGTGYVGLVTGACFAGKGNHVIALDIDEEKIRRLGEGHCPIFEPGLEKLLTANLGSGRLAFTADVGQAVRHGRVIFLCIGTPPDRNGAADLTAIQAAADNLVRHIDEPKVIAIKSTVPVGTGRMIEQRIRERTGHEVHVVSNPEFLKEGTAVEDFERPDRVVIGGNDSRAARILRELYEPFVRNRDPILMMEREAAELTKYAANAYLAMRISFINEIAGLCDQAGVNVDQVRLGIGTDQRIGMHFLHPGAGYGGSCFPKDMQALAHVGRSLGAEVDILQAVHAVNERQKEVLFRKIASRLGDDLAGRTFVIWGAAFKPRTDDIREAPALRVIEKLLAAGAAVAACDPKALDNLRAVFGDRIGYHADPYEPLDGADALVIVTEWNEYASPDFETIRRRLRRPLIFDGRNIYPPEAMARRGFEYHSIGRPTIPPDPST